MLYPPSKNNILPQLSDPSNVRVGLTVAMLCQTVIVESARGKPPGALTRNDIRCRIAYVARGKKQETPLFSFYVKYLPENSAYFPFLVHPGGWVPVAALRQVYKREYPKFLRKFTAYVAERVKAKPLRMG